MRGAALALLLLVALVPASPARAQSVGAFDGDGMWIWQVARSDAGDPARIVARARAARLSYVVVKAAQGTRWWPQFSRPLVDALHAGGLRVCAYQRAVARAPAREARVLARAVPLGADCLVIDAEIEYERKYAAAEAYVSALRDAVGEDFPVALTTFPYVHFHLRFPYSVFLGPRGAQVSLPQIYWKLLGTNPAGAFARTWSLNAIYGRPLRPIGQAFARPGVAAIAAFRRLAVAHGAAGVSWWAWEHVRSAEWRAIGAPLAVPQAPVSPPLPATLRPGNAGDPVRWLQLKLREVGHPVPVSGRFDAPTRAAVVALRASRLMTLEPVVDPALWSVLLAGPVSGPLEAITAPAPPT